MLRVVLAILLYVLIQPSFGQNGFMIIGNGIGSNKISQNKLTEIYKGKYSFWDNNKAVNLIIPGSKNILAEIVAKQIYRFYSFEDVQKFWLSLVFQGRSKPPLFSDTDEEAIKLVYQNEGSIAIVSAVSRSSVPAQFIIEIK